MRGTGPVPAETDPAAHAESREELQARLAARSIGIDEGLSACEPMA